MVKVVLREYLAGLKQAPSVSEFIRAADTTESHFYKFLGNRQKNVNRAFLDSSIRLLRASGFDVQIGDIIRFERE